MMFRMAVQMDGSWVESGTGKYCPPVSYARLVKTLLTLIAVNLRKPDHDCATKHLT